MAIQKIKSKNEGLAQRLGKDIRMPINGTFENIEGIDVLLQDIQILLLTLPGERVARPTYGCNLRNLVWENIDTGTRDGAAAIKQALDRFEPRITVTSVDFKANRDSGLVTYSIKFNVNNTDISSNLIFPFRTSQQISNG